MEDWENTPPSWGRSDDPCGTPWEGVACNNSRVTQLGLSSMGLKGTLSGDIGQLTELLSLDLSYNNDLGGPITKSIGNLKRITTLIMVACSFSGSIPSEIGDLEDLSYLALNSNNLTGIIPPSFGKLSKLYWFDIADNQLTGRFPSPQVAPPAWISSSTRSTCDHFNKNQLSGTIPESLFSSNMTLIHILFDGNRLTGGIPESLGLVTKLEVLRLDRNGLTGPVPPGIGNLTALRELNLANNRLTGEMPDFSRLSVVNHVDLSNNSFRTSEAPAWLGKLQSLTALAIQSGNLTGAVPSALFGFPQLQEVILRNNSFDGSLNLGPNISPHLQVLDFQNNNISGISFESSNVITLNPHNCQCVFPYVGTLIFSGPFFRDLTNRTRFQNPFFDSDNYLQIQLRLFPSDGPYFNRSEVMRIGFQLSNQTYRPPPSGGGGLMYSSPEAAGGEKTSIGTGVVAGIAAGGAILAVGMIFLAVYAMKQRRRAQRAVEQSRPLARAAEGSEILLFDELRRSTNCFSEANEIGSGGYGRVYRGVLPGGQLVAIKRAHQGSTQGAQEFKTEIELLSRVHHRNLVGLVGFCFDQNEQMLVYEYIPNGTLRESLSGKSGIQLNWNWRLRVALGSARGLAYLHELADPPIIHRDVKSSNIILDEDLTAKVSDFGYLDPEYYMTQQLTDRSDVYSFGVVMLELITGKVPIEKGRYIVRDIRDAMNSQDRDLCGLREFIDPYLRNSPALAGFARFVGLAVRCTSTPRAVAAAAPTPLPLRRPVVRKEVSSDSFDYSGGYAMPPREEPK
ncbi:unnamed protein product [Spirodela intermedia]|uniref:Protein kinase domain-containing protein n=1 Tax=Spirodela intermedia TaxID=51605 RepID=A0ABN7ECD6_SPIIN|nr:unnamed protein product [Spirodela intermedia]